jgi:thioredoxin 1
VEIARSEDANQQVSLSNLSPAESPAADAVLLNFYADWCGPCRSLAPTVDSLAQAGYRVQRINIDRQPDLAHRYGVSAVPCCIVVQQGREIDRVNGVATIERLKLKLRPGVRVTGSASVEPRPAWRYESSIGYRGAVVRIFCCEGVTVHAIGSGALVRWNGRNVVLTARHVVNGAKRIVIELCTGKKHEARVLKIDAVWDCAVLELSGQPEGVLPAELELGDAAMQQAGNRLESCGYGPDGRLACNSGLFLGYRRSGERPQGPDDWMILSGHARQGDSGGPVFNERGRLVGVLWGTDGESVVAVQAGRLHLLLDAAVPHPAGIKDSGRGINAQSPIQSPTPNPQSLPAVSPTSVDVGVALAAKNPCLPWRNETQKSIAAEQKEIEALISLEKSHATQPPACCPAQPTPPSTGGTPSDNTEATKGEPLSPLLTIAIVLAAFIATGLAFGLTKKK